MNLIDLSDLQKSFSGEKELQRIYKGIDVIWQSPLLVSFLDSGSHTYSIPSGYGVMDVVLIGGGGGGCAMDATEGSSGGATSFDTHSASGGANGEPPDPHNGRAVSDSTYKGNSYIVGGESTGLGENGDSPGGGGSGGMSGGGGGGDAGEWVAFTVTEVQGLGTVSFTVGSGGSGGKFQYGTDGGDGADGAVYLYFYN